MEQIDWSKAPEGATHWEPKNGSIMASWMKFERGNWWYWLNPTWVNYRGANMPAERVAAMIPRPTWDGTGLPPVGTVCEVDYEGWTQCEVIAHFQQRCGMVAAFTIDQHGNGAKTLDAFGAEHFRPIRTPEQIAAEEREKAVHAMWMCICEETPQHTPAAEAGVRRPVRRRLPQDRT